MTGKDTKELFSFGRINGSIDARHSPPLISRCMFTTKADSAWVFRLTHSKVLSGIRTLGAFVDVVHAGGHGN